MYNIYTSEYYGGQNKIYFIQIMIYKLFTLCSSHVKHVIMASEKMELENKSMTYLYVNQLILHFREKAEMKITAINGK